MELDDEIKRLNDVRQKVCEWRQEHYSNPDIQPGCDRLSKAIEHLDYAVTLLNDPMGA